MEGKECKSLIQPIRDVLDLINGKWKLPILVALSLENKRFMDLERVLTDITPRMLSKELKDLELNGLVKREVFPTSPVTVVYSLTEYGKSLDSIIIAMREWGTKHRGKIFEDK